MLIVKFLLVVLFLSISSIFVSIVDSVIKASLILAKLILLRVTCLIIFHFSSILYINCHKHDSYLSSNMNFAIVRCTFSQGLSDFILSYI